MAKLNQYLAAGETGSGSNSADGEAQKSNAPANAKRGGWITFPFIAATIFCLQLPNGGLQANLMIYLIQEFNINSIDAAQILNVVIGCSNLFPVIGAIIADSYLGSFVVISVSSFISLLGTILIASTAMSDSLRPEKCVIGSSLCKCPSTIQYAVLYTSLALACIGIGGSRFTLAAMGANQLDTPQQQGLFFSCYFTALYAAFITSATALVYVEDSVSWRLGFSLCIAVNFVGVAVFLLGKRFYRSDKPHGIPFLDLARVIVAAARKWNVPITSRAEDYYQEQSDAMDAAPAAPEQSFRFLNRAAIKTEGGDIGADGSVAKPWKLCSVQQVEDLKTIIRILPIWSSGLILITAVGVQNSLSILQALSMDRRMGPNFKIPPGSFIVVYLLASTIFIALNDSFLCPLWKKLTRRYPTPLQLIGVGHVFTVASMAVSAAAESKRLRVAHAHHLHNQPAGSTVPMSALWLFPQLLVIGIGEAFYFPTQVAMYYQEFPASLSSTATSMMALIIGIGFYLSSAFLKVIRRATTWLPEDINKGKLGSVYWTLAVLAALNFGYYLTCSILYKYRKAKTGENGSSSSGSGSGSGSVSK